MPGPAAPTGPAWALLADRVWRGQLTGAWNTVAVAGTRGVLLVDPPEGDEAAPATQRLEALVDELGAGDVVAVVLTHLHPGKRVSATLRRWPDATVHAHEAAALPGGTTHRTFSSVAVVDLGDRVLELVHPGRAHTSGDLVVLVPDVGVVAVGGLASGDGVPAYGPESFPLEWPAALDLVIGLTTPDTVVVPRTGQPLRRDDLEEQRTGVGVVAETLADLASRGVPVGDALGAAPWPFPAEQLGEAVRRGYDQLPRTARRLPLL
ncbi:MAG: hypothetical protein QOK15_2118 [Nocardioidaceae bacterium]|jgi:glyoxylase-like metal-dependent hydrolase (beta-lactamase superfamily II)|nr:hypothetical protein [Nocardioidaceae bacterium]